MPSSGRLCLLASALCLSSFGLPVSGSFSSFSSFSRTSVPQIALPQLAVRTWLSLSAVYHMPSGLAASAAGMIMYPPPNTPIITSRR
jgi:hypothetical protein